MKIISSKLHFNCLTIINYFPPSLVQIFIVAIIISQVFMKKENRMAHNTLSIVIMTNVRLRVCVSAF